MLDVLKVLHGRVAVALIVFAFILGVWSLFQLLRFHAVSGGFRASFVMLLALTGIQDVLGLLTWLSGGHMHDLLHIIYGIFGILFLPFMFVYTNRGGKYREAAFLSASCWIVLIAYGRGFMTG
ncbi:MAG: hypothetical protein ACREPI_07415 [Candidatus Dormibacterales bacterium]